MSHGDSPCHWSYLETQGTTYISGTPGTPVPLYMAGSLGDSKAGQPIQTMIQQLGTEVNPRFSRPTAVE